MTNLRPTTFRDLNARLARIEDDRALNAIAADAGIELDAFDGVPADTLTHESQGGELEATRGN